MVSPACRRSKIMLGLDVRTRPPHDTLTEPRTLADARSRYNAHERRTSHAGCRCGIALIQPGEQEHDLVARQAALVHRTWALPDPLGDPYKAGAGRTRRGHADELTATSMRSTRSPSAW